MFCDYQTVFVGATCLGGGITGGYLSSRDRLTIDLGGIKQLLEEELDPEATHDLSTDRQMCLLLEPDEWEMQDTETLLTSKDVRRKVNPMLGIIVQHSFYDDEIAKARQNPEKMNEVICKLLNVYQGARVTKWLTGDQIRQRQVDRRITDCKYDDGWNIFVGLDFGGNDDLFAIAYLAINYRQDLPPDQRMFADCAEARRIDSDPCGESRDG